jgi:hypothetical protein
MPRKPGAGKAVSKAFAYREAEKELGRSADLDSVQKLIHDKFGIGMDKTQISQYRSNEKKRRRKRGGRPKGSTSAVNATAKAPTGNTLVEFVSAVRGWENKIGAEQICKMIDALYKGK